MRFTLPKVVMDFGGTQMTPISGNVSALVKMIGKMDDEKDVV